MSKADSKDRPGLIPRLDVLAYVFHSLGTHTGIARTIAEKQTIKIYEKNVTMLCQNVEFLSPHLHMLNYTIIQENKNRKSMKTLD